MERRVLMTYHWSLTSSSHHNPFHFSILFKYYTLQKFKTLINVKKGKTAKPLTNLRSRLTFLLQIGLLLNAWIFFLPKKSGPNFHGEKEALWENWGMICLCHKTYTKMETCMIIFPIETIILTKNPTQEVLWLHVKVTNRLSKNCKFDQLWSKIFICSPQLEKQVSAMKLMLRKLSPHKEQNRIRQLNSAGTGSNKTFSELAKLLADVSSSMSCDILIDRASPTQKG